MSINMNTFLLGVLLSISIFNMVLSLIIMDKIISRKY